MIDLSSFRYLPTRPGTAAEPVHLKMKRACCVGNELWQSLLFELFFHQAIPFSLVSFVLNHYGRTCGGGGWGGNLFALHRTRRTIMCPGIVFLDDSVSKISLYNGISHPHCGVQTKQFHNSVSCPAKQFTAMLSSHSIGVAISPSKERQFLMHRVLFRVEHMLCMQIVPGPVLGTSS